MPSVDFYPITQWIDWVQQRLKGEAVDLSLTWQWIGESQITLRGLASLEQAGEGDLSFVAHTNMLQRMKASRASFLVIPKALLEQAQALLVMQTHLRGYWVTEHPYALYAYLTQCWRALYATPHPHPHPSYSPPPPPPSPNQNQNQIHPTAQIDPSVQVGQGIRLAAYVVIGANAQLHDGVSIGAHSVVGERTILASHVTLGSHVSLGSDVSIGSQSRLAAHVTIGDGCSLGQRCLLHSGAVLGADGFGFAPLAGRWIKIEQLGSVRLGNDVEIGANTCIDRGALQDTVLGDGVKLDNLVQIGHNVQVGDHTAMAGCAGVAGSAIIGQRCTVGGGAVILGHLQLTDEVHISAASVVMRSIPVAGQYTGIFPLDENPKWEKNAVTVKQLSLLRDRIRQLEREIKKSS